MSDAPVSVRLVFADRGAFHELVVALPGDVITRYDRIIDALREDPAITGGLYIDTRRLVAAFRVEGDDGGA
jgi:hypothetical protein